MKPFILFFILLLSSLLEASNRNHNLERVVLQLHWKYQFEFAGFIAAKEKGFYEEAGLDVELREYNDGINIEDDIISGKVNYGIYNSLAFLDYLRGKPLILLSSYFKRAALVLVVKPDIKSPKDLIGKRVMATTKSDFALNFGLYLNGYGVNIDDIELVPHSYGIDDFTEGRVDAITAFVSNEIYQLDNKGIKYNVLDPSDDNFYILQLELITSQKEVDEHPQRTKAFRDASLKGWQYALNHKDEMVEIISSKYQRNLSKEDIAQEANGVQRLLLPYTYELGSIDRSFLKKQQELFAQEYKLKSKRDLDGYIFDPDHKQGEALKLSDEEKDYIEKHRKISMCINYELFPLDGVKNGKLNGQMADIFSIISQKTSLEFTSIASSSEKDLMQNIQAKRCQVLSVMATFNRAFKTLKPTTPFGSTAFALLSKLERSFIDDLTLLKDKTLIVQKDSFKVYLNYLYPYLNIRVEYDKNKMVQDVLQNRAYGIVTLDEQADYFIDKYGYGKLKISGFLAKERPIQGSIGVQEDEPILYSILEKALLSIPKEKIESIRNSWRISRYQTKIDYSLAIKIMLFMGIIVLIMIYYQRKLKNFNKELEQSVYAKTKELLEINESLEAAVAQKVEELIQKDEILTEQSKQAVMGEMISMIAHQWRQPLNTITLQISNLQIQQMMGDEIDKEELIETLSQISKTIVYLSNTIDDFQTYFHPNKNATRIKLAEIIDKSIKFITPRFKGNSIAIVVDDIEDIEVNVYVNELIQVILNILNNAVDAYEKIDSSEKFIKISAERIGSDVEIAIEDAAGGIKKEHMKKLFEPYFSTKGKNGTGLGLYMSRMIIEKQFGGEIKVESKDTKTIFRVRFPQDIKAR